MGSPEGVCPGRGGQRPVLLPLVDRGLSGRAQDAVAAMIIALLTALWVGAAAAVCGRCAQWRRDPGGIRPALDEGAQPGGYLAIWDGRDDGGEPVASGRYVARMAGAGFEREIGMTLLK